MPYASQTSFSVRTEKDAKETVRERAFYKAALSLTPLSSYAQNNSNRK